MGYNLLPLLAGVLAGVCVALWFALARSRSKIAELRRVLMEVRSSTKEAIEDLDGSIAAGLAAQQKMKQLEQLTDHLSDAIGVMQKSRDRWKEMFFVQAHEHGNGQALLERALTRNREYVIKLVAAVNAERKGKGMDPITKVEQLDDPPLGTAEAYREAMRELADKAPEDPDMVAERDRLLSAK
jgi:hypothetical protein